MTNQDATVRYNEPVSEPSATPLPGPGTDAKIRLIEARYRACWNCIQVGAYHHCRHYAERQQERAMDETRIGFTLDKWRAQAQTRSANVEAFNGAYSADASPIEVRLLQAFWDVGLDPVQQYNIAGYVVDFAFPKARIAVEADGDAYHQDDARERRRDEAIRKAGWHIVHFTGREIHRDADSCVRDVYQLARSSFV